MYGVVACERSCCVGHAGVTVHSPCQNHIHPPSHRLAIQGVVYAQAEHKKAKLRARCPSLLLSFPALCKSPDGWQQSSFSPVA